MPVLPTLTLFATKVHFLADFAKCQRLKLNRIDSGKSIYKFVIRTKGWKHCTRVSREIYFSFCLFGISISQDDSKSSIPELGLKFHDPICKEEKCIT